jgi:site-specific recombinase XerD
MDQARIRFEQHLKRCFGQASTLKHYISDLNIFIDTVDHRAPQAATAEDIDSCADQQIAAGLSPAIIKRRLASPGTLQ